MSVLDLVSLIKVEIAFLCFSSRSECERESNKREAFFFLKKNGENIFFIIMGLTLIN